MCYDDKKPQSCNSGNYTVNSKGHNLTKLKGLKFPGKMQKIVSLLHAMLHKILFSFSSGIAMKKRGLIEGKKILNHQNCIAWGKTKYN